MRDKYDNEALLDGLTGSNYDAVKTLTDKIDYDKITNEITAQCIVPVLRKITLLVVDTKDKQMIIIAWRKIPLDVLYKNINVDEIINQLTLMYKNLLPKAYKYIPNLDMQAELTSLYCNNYVLGLVNEYLEKND